MSAPVLVTGGAGFIGSHLAERLAREGRRVRVLDDFSSGRDENLASAGGRVELHRADVRDPAALGRAMRGAELVFHLAAVPSVPASVADPIGTHDRNLGGTLAVLEAARSSGVRRVVFASSCAVYGDAQALPVV